MYEYITEKNSLVDMNGVREIEAREDLQEPDSMYWRNKSEQFRKERETREHNQEPPVYKSLFSDEVDTWKRKKGLNKKTL